MGYEDELRALRTRVGVDAEDAARRWGVASGLPAFAARVTNGGAMPTAVPGQFRVSPVIVRGVPVEGGPFTLTTVSKPEIVTVLGPKVPAVNDMLIASRTRRHWVADTGDGKGSSGPPPGDWLVPIQLQIGMCAVSDFVPTYMGYPTNVNVLVVQGGTTLYNGPPVHRNWGTTGPWSGIYTGVRVNPVVADVPVVATVTAPGFKTATYTHTPILNEVGYPGADLVLIPDDGYACAPDPCCSSGDQPGFPFSTSKFVSNISTLFFNDGKGVFTLSPGLCVAASTPTNPVYGFTGCDHRTAKWGYPAVSRYWWPYFIPSPVQNVSCPVYVEAYCQGVRDSGPYEGRSLWAVEGYCITGKTYDTDPSAARCGAGPVLVPAAGECPIDSGANCPGLYRFFRNSYLVAESCPPGFTATGGKYPVPYGGIDIYGQFYDSNPSTGVLFQ